MNIHIETIFQFDELIEHARFHKEMYDDDFFTFLSKHYGELKIEHEKNHQDEKKDHKKLPFQNIITTFTFVEKLISIPLYSSRLIFSLEQKKQVFYYRNSTASGYKSGVFQPPKLV